MNRRSTLVVALALAAASQATPAAPLTVTVSDRAGKPLVDAVVAVLPKGARAPAGPGATAQIAQKDRQFQPQVSVVQTGTAVSFPNLDTVRHHVYSFSPIQKFELKLYAGTPAAPVVFDKPGVAVLGCNIHDRMQAYVVVVETPLFARTDGSGRATIEVPPGEHRLQTWHATQADPMTLAEQPLSMTASGAQVQVTVTGGS